MSYSDDKIFNVTLPKVDFGDGATVDIQSFRLPPGYKGELIQIGASITETFNTDNAKGTIKVGLAANDDAYGAMTIPHAAADKDFFDQTDDTDAIIAAAAAQDAQIPAGTLIQVTTTAGTMTSGTAAGMAVPILTFRIWK